MKSGGKLAHVYITDLTFYSTKQCSMQLYVQNGCFRLDVNFVTYIPC